MQKDGFSTPHRTMAPQSSIITGFDAVVEEYLRIEEFRAGDPPFLKHPTTLKRFLERGPVAPPHDLGLRLAEVIERNFGSGAARAFGRTNWVLRRKSEINPKDISKERLLEKRIIAVHPEEEGWWNQLSTSSGLIGKKADGRRAVDLVRQTGESEFELIELKYDSDTPLFASVELLRYAFIYLFSRNQAGKLGYNPDDHPVLFAKTIHLRVLAPFNYFPRQDPKGATASLNKAFNSVVGSESKRCGDLKMDFDMMSFPQTFCWAEEHRDARGDEAIRNAVRLIEPVFPLECASGQSIESTH